MFGDKDLARAAGHLAGGDPGAVLGADERQIRLGLVGAVLGRLQFALEATDARQVLRAHALLQTQTNKQRLALA